VIVYQRTKHHFLADVTDRVIEDIVATQYLAATGCYASDSEYRSWQHSLGQMANVLRDNDLPDDMGVGIEFGIPQTSKRIDFLLSGRSADNVPHVIIVELKQWSESTLSDKDGIVVARRGGGGAAKEGPHPSYQAWSYAALLEGFNEAVYDGGVELRPCAYLHNYLADGIIDHVHYAPYIEKAPLFLKGEEERKRLRTFIKQHVKHGDNAELLYQIDQGRIRPSRMLVDSLAKMMKGNREFILVDDQKVVFESAIAVAKAASADNKQVLIIKGGPGTGKSVVAINLLVELSKLGLVGKYVSKNAAPRAVYKAKLTGTLRQTEISHLFAGSGSFVDTPPNTFDVLIVDEAHRLNEKSGLYGNLGENQIKELISSAKCTVLFVDDDQIVTLKDIGRSTEIRRWANALGAKVTDFELSSQFRCNGSDGYVSWLDHTLGIRETAHATFDGIDFDFRVIDSPVELHALIGDKNAANNKSRVVAGYCWDWVSKRRPQEFDIRLEEHGYSRRWNLDRDGSLWIMAPQSIDEVGCIHTCQGLELDYVGVIIGPDLLARSGRLVSAPDNRSRMDKSIMGYKKQMRVAPEATSSLTDQIIRNTYKTLMTRGLKGCFVYCTDPETQEHFQTVLRARNIR